MVDSVTAVPNADWCTKQASQLLRFAMPLLLKTDYHDTIPLEVEGITPDVTRGQTLAVIERLPVFRGNRQCVLADFFVVSGDPSDGQIDWEGTLAHVHWLGANMNGGSMRIDGPAGRHLGSRMRAGEITVRGDVGDWVGAEMGGGVIRVLGNAEHLAGAGYRGSARGMTGGVLLIHGDAGNEVGHAMRRGLIAVAGRIGDLAGMNMLAGSLLAFGGCGLRHGAGMRRGTIALLGSDDFTPLPTFRFACQCRLEILRLIAASLGQYRFPVPPAWCEQQVRLLHGDLLEGGRGELLLPVQ